MPRGVELGKLNKHACIFGVPGSGKTGAIFNLLLPLYDRAITFMVIESAKTEYRVLKTLKDHGNPSVRRLASEFQVYTLGDDTLSPFRENLLARVEGISPGEHIESILGNFQAAMPMSGPLPALLGEALERVFDAGGGATPRMADLVRATREVLAEKGYSPETTSDIRAALEVRLGVLIRRGIGRVFQCRQSVPSIEQLASAPSVIELDRLSRDHKALITLSLLTRLLQFFKTRPYPDQSVRFVLFIEEAHNIVGPSHEAAASEENADPRAFAADLICRMLAELRALGVAIVIVDQLPTAVAPEVIKNTATKLAFRQPEKEEREVLAGAMRLGPVETEELAVLQPGEAYLYTEGYYAARRIRTPNVYEELNIGRPPIGDRILPYLQDDPWFARAATERCSDELDQLLDQLNLFDLETDQLVGRIKLLCQRHPAILADHQGPARRQALVELRRQSRRLKAEILDRLRTFQRDVYRPLLGDVSAAPLGDCGLSDLRAHVIDRYENTTKPATQGCAQVLDRLIGRCATSTT